MTKRSAGILMYRGAGPALELLLVHPGGPFWAKKDQGAWSIPKGEYSEDEEPLACAMREFAEELGSPLPQGAYLELGALVQPSRKMVVAYAVEGEFDPARPQIKSFRDGMAAQKRAPAILPRDRPRPMVRRGRGAGENPAGAGALHRPAGCKNGP